RFEVIPQALVRAREVDAPVADAIEAMCHRRRLAQAACELEGALPARAGMGVVAPGPQEPQLELHTPLRAAGRDPRGARQCPLVVCTCCLELAQQFVGLAAGDEDVRQSRRT